MTEATLVEIDQPVPTAQNSRPAGVNTELEPADARCTFEVTTPKNQRWWARPAVTVTPAAMLATGGGHAAQVLARTVYWCSPRPARQAYRPIYRTQCVIPSNGGPLPCWDTCYRSMAEQLGTGADKARRAVEKLCRISLLSRSSSERRLFTPTPAAWELFRRPNGPNEIVGVRQGDEHGRMNRFRVVPRQVPGHQVVYVPTTFVLICGGDFNTAVVLANLVFWAGRNARAAPDSPEKSVIWKLWPRLATETGLTRHQLQRAVKSLEAFGIVETWSAVPRRQHVPRRHFRVVEAVVDRALRALTYEEDTWSAEEDC